MKKIVGVCAVACLAVAGSNAVMASDSMAGYQSGDVLAHVRAINLSWDNSSGISGLDAQDKTIPELDFSYFFTSNISAELVLAYTTVDVDLNGASIGSLKVLPPTLTAQYRFMPDNPYFRPYVGVGVNYTNFSSYSLVTGSGSSNSWGGAVQVGFDVPITASLTLNADVKKIWIRNDLTTTTGAPLTTLTLNPIVAGIGLGWKF